jgi:hypothetical protein
MLGENVDLEREIGLCAPESLLDTSFGKDLED